MTVTPPIGLMSSHQLGERSNLCRECKTSADFMTEIFNLYWIIEFIKMSYFAAEYQICETCEYFTWTRLNSYLKFRVTPSLLKASKIPASPSKVLHGQEEDYCAVKYQDCTIPESDTQLTHRSCGLSRKKTIMLLLSLTGIQGLGRVVGGHSPLGGHSGSSSCGVAEAIMVRMGRGLGTRGTGGAW